MKIMTRQQIGYSARFEVRRVGPRVRAFSNYYAGTLGRNFTHNKPVRHVVCAGALGRVKPNPLSRNS